MKFPLRMHTLNPMIMTHEHDEEVIKEKDVFSIQLQMPIKTFLWCQRQCFEGGWVWVESFIKTDRGSKFHGSRDFDYDTPAQNHVFAFNAN